MKKKEESLQMQVCRYLKLQYPNVLFVTDMAAGMRLTIGQAVKAKAMRSSRGLPDLIILQPRGLFHGMCLELKVEGTRLRKKNGDYSTPHIAEQGALIERLNQLGYCSAFAVGFNRAKEIIDNYLN